MKRIISVITSIMVTLSFTLPAELVFAEENLAPEAEQVVEQEAKATDDCADCHDETCTECAEDESEASEPEVVTEEATAATEEPTEYVPNEVIVVFDNNKSLKKAETTAENAVEETEGSEVAENIEVETISKTDKAVLVQSDENIDELALCEELERQEGVAFAQPNYIYQFDSDANQKATDALLSSQWYLDYIDAPEAWNYIDALQANKQWNDTHPRVKIATLDTGIITGHDDLKSTTEGGNISSDHCVAVEYTGSSSSDEKYTVTKYSKVSGKHGTHTASVIAATSNNGVGVAGVAAGNDNDIIELMPIDVFRMKYESQANATTADVVAGLDYAVKQGASVVMMCLGHEWNSNDGLGETHDDLWLHKKIKWAVNEKDVVIAASAGNNSEGGTTKSWYPSDFTEVISCINTQEYKDSSSKDCKNPNSNYGLRKDISAPGTNIKYVDSGKDGYDDGSGTSFSAAVVAGVAALVRYVNPELSQKEVKSILYSTTTDLYIKGFDIYTAWGNVNAYNAVVKAADNQPQTDEHILIHHEKLEATCTTEGCKEYWTCSICDKIFADSEGKAETSLDQLTIPATGKHTPTIVGAYGAGCTTTGYSGDTKCSTCGTLLSSGYAIPAHGHYIVKTKKVNPTCCSVGYSSHYECVYCHTCYKDKKGKKTTSLSKYKIRKKSHSYTKKIAAPQYLKKAATTKSAAIYYKSCKWCGKKGKSTFKYGKKLPK